jgi:hypothetical protein
MTPHFGRAPHRADRSGIAHFAPFWARTGADNPVDGKENARRGANPGAGEEPIDIRLGTGRHR